MSGIYIPEVRFPPKPWSNMLIIVLDGNKGTAQFTLAENLEKVEVPFTIVPDHGDLIERDALKKECQENAKRGMGLWVDYMDISLAPTIIPASKEDGE